MKTSSRVSGVVTGLLALAAIACAQSALQQSSDAAPEQKDSPSVIEFSRQTLDFKPTRDDMTVGRVVISVFCAKPGEVRVNGVKPDPAWRDIHLTSGGEIVVDERSRTAPADGAAWIYISLRQLSTNQFEMPPLKLEFPTNDNNGLFCISIKVWFNEVSNQYDSLFYQKTDDRYALASYCTSSPDSSAARSRFKQNRVATVREFTELFSKPFVIRLKQTPLRKEWAP
jgi:hypothetical protein